MAVRLDTCFQCLRKAHLLEIGMRSFQTSSCLNKKKDMSKKAANVMARIIAKSEMSKHKKRKWFLNSNLQQTIPQGKGPSAGMVRRAQHISSILSEYVVRTIQSGDLGQELSAVEISKVRVLPDFSSVNIYWSLTGTDRDSEVEKLLQQKAPTLRYILQNNQLVANIPPILFVKDGSQLNAIEVEKLLEVADFGEDYVCQKTKLAMQVDQLVQPTPATDKKEKPRWSAKADLDDEHSGGKIYDDISNLDDEAAVRKDRSGREFRQDLYGLEHDKIMQKLLDNPPGNPTDAIPTPGLDAFSGLTKRNRKQAVDMYTKLLRRKRKSEKPVEYSYSDYLKDVKQEREQEEGVHERDNFSSFEYDDTDSDDFEGLDFWEKDNEKES